MRVAYVGRDLLADCIRVIPRAGHRIERVVTPPGPGGREVESAARHARAQFERRRVDAELLSAWESDGIELLIVAGYPARIPIEAAPGLRAINIHPSLLPEGRGPWPIPWAILNGQRETGVTIHELTSHIDQGPILKQQRIHIGSAETTRSLLHEMQRVAPDLLRTVLESFEHCWEARTPQGEGTYYPRAGRDVRTIHWDGPIVEADRVWRAFGRHAIAEAGGRPIPFGWISTRPGPAGTPGTILSERGGTTEVAAADGVVVLHPLPAAEKLWRRVAALRPHS